MVLGRSSAVFSSQKVNATYDGLIVQGRTESEIEGLSIRFDNTEEWMPMYLVRSATGGDFLASVRNGFEGSPSSFELAFEGASLGSVSIVVAGYFRNEEEPLGLEREFQASENFASTQVRGVISAPKIHTRADWGAESFIGSTSPLGDPYINNITFHHAAGFGAENLNEGLAQVKAIQDFHQNGRGWSDIGYHFVVDEAGNLFQGRPYRDANATFESIPPLARGAHAGGANTGNIGVCLLGCYHPAETAYSCLDSISPATLDSLTTVFAFLAENYTVETKNLTGHRDWGNTSCPGDNNYVLIPDIKIGMDNLLTFGQEPSDSYVLGQPFPNPVLNETKLAYFLLRDGITTLKVFDSLGREQSTLVSEFQDGSSWYAFDFSTAGLSPGKFCKAIGGSLVFGVLIRRTANS